MSSNSDSSKGKESSVDEKREGAVHSTAGETDPVDIPSSSNR